MKIWREWCPRCGGSGHDGHCACDDGVAFMLGCCTRCHGEGMIRVQSAGIIVTDADQPPDPPTEK